MKNLGFRFFRDDALLKEYEKMIKCPICGLSYYPDEIAQKNQYEDNLCISCFNTIGARIKRLESREKIKCPIEGSFDYIFSKQNHHTHKRLKGRRNK